MSDDADMERDIPQVPGVFALHQRIIYNNYNAHDEQGDNPGLDGVLYNR